MAWIWRRGRVSKFVGVHFRHHQRHRRVHPEGGGVVHHQRPSLNGKRRISVRDRGAGGEQREVDTCETVLGQRFDRDPLAAKQKGAPGRTRRGQQTQRAHWEAARFQAVQQLHAYGPGRTDDCDGQAARSRHRRQGRSRGSWHQAVSNGEAGDGCQLVTRPRPCIRQGPSRPRPCVDAAHARLCVPSRACGAGAA